MSSDSAHHAALAVESRRHLLETLRTAGEPTDIATLAEAVALHVTTARAHLGVLEQAGLVRRAADRSGRRGRPRQLYVATPTSQQDQGHRQLATVLAGALSADSGVATPCAEQAGRRWAEDEVPVTEDLSWEDANDQLVEVFERLGFAPRTVEDRQGVRLELDGCPFRELARTYPEVVCTVHRGLLRATLERLGSPGAEQAGLRPFVGPTLCVTDLPRPVGDPATSPNPS